MAKQTVKLRQIELGSGRPKIAVPITGTTQSAIIEQAKAVKAAGPDLVEWRIDFFEGVQDAAQLTETGQQLRETLGDLALLTTFRTKGEGGELVLSDDTYFDICKQVVAGGYTDALDVERFHDETSVKGLVQAAHEANIVVIMSNHDFDKTPEVDDLVGRLTSMAEFGADVPKMAVMPNSVEDVLTLLTATRKADQKLTQPIITMSMADLGKVSRIAGEVFGSAVSFGTVGAASAPGQISLTHMKNDLDDLKLTD